MSATVAEFGIQTLAGFLQIAAFCTLFATRRMLSWRLAPPLLAYALAFALLNLVLSELGLPSNRWYYLLAQFGLVWAFVRLAADLDAAESAHYALIAVVCTTFLDYAFGTAVMHVAGSIPLRGLDNIPSRIVATASLSVLEAAELLLVRWLLGPDVHRPTLRRTVAIGVAGVILYLFDTTAVDLINTTGDAARVYLAQLGEAQNMAGLRAQTTVQALCAVTSVVVVVGIERAFRSYEYEQELAKTNYLMRMQSQYYELKKEMIDEVNRHYHDLRHFLETLRRLDGDAGENQGYIEDLERKLREYELLCHTGNVALDIVLTDKLRRCNACGVTLLFLADGTLFDKVEAVDLVSIFGNALDNAIEAAVQVDDPARRVVELKTNANDNWVSVRVENPYAHRLRHGHDGALGTTKPDANLHGLGLSSIDCAAKKYGGFLSYEYTDDTFVLTVMLGR